MPELPDSPVVSLPVAAKLLGIGKSLAYTRARTGELAPGVPVIRFGSRIVIPTAPLRTALGMDA